MASTYRQAVAHGWLPDQHGSWPIALVPPLVGIVLGGPAWPHLLLVGTWMCCFFLFNATTLWLKSSRRRRYRAATLFWLGLTVVGAATLVILHVSVLAWVPVFLPFVALALYEMWRGRSRSTISRLTTVLTSCLMTPVAYDLGANTGRMETWWPWQDHTDITAHAGWGHVWLVTLALTLYFVGTIPATRVLFRRRGDARWFRLSVAYHAVALGIVAAIVAAGAISWPVLVVFALILARNIVLPRMQAKRLAAGAGGGAGGGLPVMLIGLTETAQCLAVAVTVLL